MTRQALPDDIYEKLLELSEEARELEAAGYCENAIEVYLTALTLLPEPYTNWNAATWLYSAVGDCYFALQDWKNSLFQLQQAVQCPDGLGNPYIHLRLGQCQFELGQFDFAADELMHAYMGDAEQIFATEDPKYFEFLKTRADIK